MARKLSGFLAVAALALLVVQPARAESKVKTAEGMVAYDSVSELVASAQNRLSTYYREASALDAQTRAAIGNKRRSLFATQTSQKTALTNIEEQLTSAIFDLVSAQTGLAILPDIRNFNQGLLQLTNDYQQEIQLTSSGPYFQRKRDAFSLMFQQLQLELLNTRTIISERRKNVETVRDELLQIARYPTTASSVKLTALGFDHFINLRTQILANQPVVLNDIATLNLGTDIAYNAGSVINPCAQGDRRFSSFQSTIQTLWPYTQNFSNQTTINKVSYTESSPITWASTRTDLRNSLANNSPEDIEGLLGGFTADNQIFYPGVIEGWNACIYTKTNILNDLKIKIANEMEDNHTDAAITLDELANDLEIEINLLKGQKTRLSQFKNIITALESIASSAGYGEGNPMLQTGNWKPYIGAHLYNLQRMFQVEVDVLNAGLKLAEISQNQITALASIADPAAAADLLYPAASKLDAIARAGFQRLESELASAADSFAVMSANVKSTTSLTDDGGIREAISAFGAIVSARDSAMRRELETGLPKDKTIAENLISKIQAQRTEAFALYSTTLAKIDQVTQLELDRSKVDKLLNSFFAIRTSHPAYVSLVNKFLAAISLSAKPRTEVTHAVNELLARLPTTGNGRVSRQLCTGKNATACKKVRSAKQGKSLKGQLVKSKSSISQLLDENAAGILGTETLSTLSDKAKSILSSANAL